MTLRTVMCVGHGTGAGAILGSPLMGAGGALCQLPLESKQVFKIVVAPLCWRRCPGTFKTTGNGIAPMSFPECIFPTKILLFNASTRRFTSHVFAWVSSAMGF